MPEWGLDALQFVGWAIVLVLAVSFVYALLLVPVLRYLMLRQMTAPLRRRGRARMKEQFARYEETGEMDPELREAMDEVAEMG